MPETSRSSSSTNARRGCESLRASARESLPCEACEGGGIRARETAGSAKADETYLKDDLVQGRKQPPSRLPIVALEIHEGAVFTALFRPTSPATSSSERARRAALSMAGGSDLNIELQEVIHGWPRRYVRLNCMESLSLSAREHDVAPAASAHARPTVSDPTAASSPASSSFAGRPRRGRASWRPASRVRRRASQGRACLPR